MVPKKDSDITAAELRGNLGNNFQDAFIPSAFVFLDKLPLLPNGKVNRKALPATNLGDTGPGETFVLPRTPIEKILAELWQVALRKEQIGIHDNFFDLGGHSLLMTQVAYRISADIGVDIPLAQFFKSPTIRDLSLFVSEALLSKSDQVEI